ISPGTRLDRHDRASQKTTRRNQPLAQLPCCDAVKVGEASLARRSKAKEAVPRPPLTYKEALAWLYSLQRFGIKLGLENIRRLLAELHVNLGSARASRATPVRLGLSSASPETPNVQRVIHVAGTNGKGSVCAMID